MPHRKRPGKHRLPEFQPDARSRATGADSILGRSKGTGTATNQCPAMRHDHLPGRRHRNDSIGAGENPAHGHIHCRRIHQQHQRRPAGLAKLGQTEVLQAAHAQRSINQDQIVGFPHRIEEIQCHFTDLMTANYKFFNHLRHLGVRLPRKVNDTDVHRLPTYKRLARRTLRPRLIQSLTCCRHS